MNLFSIETKGSSFTWARQGVASYVDYKLDHLLCSKKRFDF